MKFMKWHGAGNDFILMKSEDLTIPSADYLSELAKRVCHRKFGIGADGLMIVFPSENADFKMVYYNSDGSYAAMCGNGIRCFSAYCIHEGLTFEKEFSVETGDGIKIVKAMTDDGYQLTVEMGTPVLSFEEVPTLLEDEGLGKNMIRVENETYLTDVMKVGVPHTVIDLENRNYNEQDFRRVGSMVENLPIFPSKTNVNFVKKLEGNVLRVDTWERGAGLTLACGTGVCASAYSFFRRGLVTMPVDVEVAGGKLTIDYSENRILMTGPAVPIATGEFY